MGLDISNNSIKLSDGSGNTRFSTDRLMPHLMNLGPDSSGVFSVPAVTGTVTVTEYVGESTTSLVRGDFTASLVQRHTVYADPIIVAGTDSFCTAFLSLNAGIFATPTGQYISAYGSNIIDLFIRNDGYYAGATILNIEISDGKVELVSRTEIVIPSANTIVDHAFIGWNPSAGSTANQTLTVSSTAYSVGYKIYYGRFN